MFVRLCRIIVWSFGLDCAVFIINGCYHLTWILTPALNWVWVSLCFFRFGCHETCHACLQLAWRWHFVWQVKVLVTQLCPTLCDPMDCSPPGSSVHGIFQARILEWVAISYSRGYSQPRDQTLSLVSLHSRRILYYWATREVSFLIFNVLSNIKPLLVFLNTRSLKK